MCISKMQRALYVPDCGLFNIYHFLIYCVSGLRQLSDLDKITNIYVNYGEWSAHFFMIDNAKTDIDGSHIANAKYRIAANKVYNFVTEAFSLLLPNAAIEDNIKNCPADHIKIPEYQNAPDGYPSPEAYVFLRSTFMPHILGASLASPNLSPYLYISRNLDSDRRRILNEDALFENCAALQNFQRITISDFTLLEQMAIFNRAKVIIAAHGACLVNTIFCEPGTTVIEISSDFLASKRHFSHIADNSNIRHMRYYATRHPNPNFAAGDGMAENLTIDNIADFDDFVRRAEN